MVSSVSNWEGWLKTLGVVMGLVGALPAVISAVRDVVSGVSDFTSRPGVFWMRVGALYPMGLVAAVLVAAAWTWRLRLGRRAKPWVPLVVRVVITVVLPLLATIVMVVLLAPSPEHDRDLAGLFPQTVRRGGGWIRVYGNNGAATYVVVGRSNPLADAEVSADITFHAFGEGHDYSSGWVIFFLRGVSFGEFKTLKFYVRGRAGQERIGVKAKDAVGTESSVQLDERYLAAGITRSWQEVKIPFTHFGRVRFDMLENVSLYSTGQMARTTPQTISVRGFAMVRD